MLFSFPIKEGTKVQRIHATYFWSKIKSGDKKSCWPWQGYCDPRGYGRYGRVLAHRIAYCLKHGSVPNGMAVCHACDNPPCCNPDHLWLGTQIENIADRVRKGRTRTGTRRGELSNKAKLTPEQAIEIFHSKESGPVLARRFGISKEAVNHIKRGRNWAHITGGRDAR